MRVGRVTRSMLPTNQAEHPEQDDRADEGDEDGSGQAAEGNRDVELPEDEAADEGADDADDDVADGPSAPPVTAGRTGRR